MNNDNQEEHWIKPISRNDKNFIYKGRKYPINFESVKSNSNYFYVNSENFKEENIELHEKIDIKEDTINSFIECCQNKPFNINDSNVFQLDYLSKKYEVPELSKITQEYLNKPNTNLAFQSLLFKHQLHINSSSNDDLQFFDTSNEEEILGHKLHEYLNDERLLDLPIPIIDRILKKYLKENKNNNDQIIEFLFKCLDKHQRKASILFLNINIDDQPKDLIIRLMNDYWDVFDFNMVNLKSILMTSSELLKKLTKVKIEFDQKISEMNKIIEEQKNEINKFNESRNFIDKDLKNFIQKQNQIIEEQKNEIKKINDDRNLLNDELKRFIQKQNAFNEEQNNKINKITLI